MKSAKIFSSIVIASLLILSQVVVALAAPPLQTTYISGEVRAISVQTDASTGIHTIVVTLIDAQRVEQKVRISEKDAFDIGLIYYKDAGPVPDEEWLGYWVDIESTLVIPDLVVEMSVEPQHAVGGALATFFDFDYKVIMDTHDSGTGFGIIAQALWMTQKLLGDDSSAEEKTALFLAIVTVKKDGNYEEFYNEFFPDEETIPSSWGEFKKALLAGDKKVNLGVVMSQKDKDNNGAGNTDNGGSNNPNNANSNKDKNKDKSNNSGGNGNGGGSGNGNGNDKKP